MAGFLLDVDINSTPLRNTTTTKMVPVSKSDPIVIVGAGAFGLSTALHLVQAGYTNITVLDKGATVPSGFSAANDINKILRVEYDDDFYTELAVVSIFLSIMIYSHLHIMK